MSSTLALNAAVRRAGTAVAVAAAAAAGGSTESRQAPTSSELQGALTQAQELVHGELNDLDACGGQFGEVYNTAKSIELMVQSGEMSVEQSANGENDWLMINDSMLGSAHALVDLSAAVASNPAVQAIILDEMSKMRQGSSVKSLASSPPPSVTPSDIMAAELEEQRRENERLRQEVHACPSNASGSGCVSSASRSPSIDALPAPPPQLSTSTHSHPKCPTPCSPDPSVRCPSCASALRVQRAAR